LGSVGLSGRVVGSIPRRAEPYMNFSRSEHFGV
jgi:hypothetical protein